MDEVKAVITLRSGKEVEQPVPKPAEEGTEEKEAEPKEKEPKPEKIVIKEDAEKKSTPHLFLILGGCLASEKGRESEGK